MDALNDFKRLKRKSESECFNNELAEFKKIVNENNFDHSRYTEFLRFILENAETERGDKRKKSADPASQPVVKDKTQWQMDFPEIIEIDDEDEDEDVDDDEVSSPCGHQAGRQAQKDKGKRVVSENPAKLQRDVLPNKGILISPFVPLKKYHESGDNVETLAFRNDVLEVLRKPFNLEEYLTLMEAIKAGSYHDYYPEFIEILRSQHKQEKRLAILRGFFFRLQNLTREGAFRPWNDHACLEVNPRHVV